VGIKIIRGGGKKMKKISALFCAVCLLCMTGCAMVMTPAMGGLYSELKGPGMATSNSSGAKVGKASCASILGWFATGDASIETAAKNGGITKIKSVDFEVWSILFLYARLTTVVTGE